MKKIILLFVLFVSVECISQNKQILYNFTSVPQSLMTNPGSDVKYKWYFGIPLLSGISANVGSSGFSAYDLFANDGVDFNVKLRNVVFSTTRKDKATINEQIELFNGGFKVGDWQSNSYISFGMYQEFDFLSYMPKDLAILALDGNRDYLGKVFNLGDLNVKAEMLSVLHIGYHKNIKNNLIVGLRGKIYSSAFNATSTKNSGYIYTIPSTNGIYEQVISSNLELNTSGISKYIDEDYSGDVVRDIKQKVFFGGDLGLGFDAGLTYYPKKNIQFTASLVDVGFIRHTKDVETFTFKGYYKYDGINPKFTNGNAAGNVYQEFKDAIPLDTLYTKYTTWRPAKFNSSIQYSFDDSRSKDCNCDGTDSGYRNAVGAQLFIMSTPRTPFMAFTTYYRRNIFNNLQMKATYTLDSYSYKNIGLGLSAQLGKLNLYVLADNLLEYHDLAKANSLSFQFGLNVIFKDSDEPY
ncbi:DUF5723 family protein [Flavobacterium gawalongense]|uniref:DUF5723 domain-containing protein n=1 Tax=Flavobacterium gawalongense TaxID=2594432 RepID=A0A553BBY7_9FLAO|nr:DUF5723 family protein [Flavobacterium gawalongense]TRW98029.1 hypothetical protein FNW33_16130 [Flavobacterium gawalongense]TRX02542.1 hypothetical protein FNW12_16145 [Flavobacterium gawalongense]TRX05755.1 hypothetical protein FNW11_15760 [Flavobacterium gawalongense]TRX06673.1 hypothetical protein FNW10_15720 [Flavobacterium gawalongense]TRX22372.1 hypothetical protein FNW38_15860 [Flavobacterium gawalongense]